MTTTPDPQEPADSWILPEHETNHSAAPLAEDRPIRVGSIVWGGLVVALCALMIVFRQTTLNLDVGQTLIWLLLAAGVALVAGGIASLVRRR